MLTIVMIRACKGLHVAKHTLQGVCEFVPFMVALKKKVEGSMKQCKIIVEGGLQDLYNLAPATVPRTVTEEEKKNWHMEEHELE